MNAMHRCHACMEIWVGENSDPDNRCPYCEFHNLPVSPVIQAMKAAKAEHSHE